MSLAVAVAKVRACHSLAVKLVKQGLDVPLTEEDRLVLQDLALVWLMGLAYHPCVLQESRITRKVMGQLTCVLKRELARELCYRSS